MKRLDMVALATLIVGGFNWGILGLFDFNIFSYVIGSFWITNVICFIIGVAAIYLIIRWNYIFHKVKK